MKFVVFISISLTSMLLFANGQERGNGGDAVVCYNPGFKDAIVRDLNQITSVELLDLYEGRVLKGMHFDTPISQDYLAIAKDQIQKLKALSPTRFNFYMKDLEAFKDEMIDPHGIQLTDIDDSKHIAIPINCKIEQLVIQKNPEFPGEKRYTIDADLWDRMDAANRAATVTHEIIYKEMLYKNDSRSVRHLNSLLNSRNFANMSHNLWFVHQHWTRTPYLEHEGLIFRLGSLDNETPFFGLQNSPKQNYSTIDIDSEPFSFYKDQGARQSFDTAFGGKIKHFNQAEMTVNCTFSKCDYISVKAWSKSGVRVSVLNVKLNLELDPNLRVTQMALNSKFEPQKIQLSAGSLGFQATLQGFTIKVGGVMDLNLEQTDKNLWVPIFKSKNQNFIKESFVISGHPGTQTIKLELGVLTIQYLDSKEFKVQVFNESDWDERALDHEIKFGKNGRLEYIKLSGTKSGRAYYRQEI